jgi:acyl carrier protein
MTHVSIIKQFVTEEFAPDISANDLDADLDLLSSGVIDSLGLLKLIAWIETTFDVVVDDAALDPDNFRTVSAIDGFIERAAMAQAEAS